MVELDAGLVWLFVNQHVGGLWRRDNEDLSLLIVHEYLVRVLEDDVPCMQHAGDPSQKTEANVDEEVARTKALLDAHG